ncbi:MAG: carbohydrate binding family 9 domain-containing protein, partial [Acidobacteriota bacterium]|nr:carbohydrate binding family 9 domain-containing protein [Acidobacteriota bacterium]
MRLSLGSALRFGLAALVFAAAPPSLPAADDTPQAAVRALSGKIRLDGVLDEPQWRESPGAIRLTQVEPRAGEPPTEDTRVWLAQGEDALYIAVFCEDGAPGRLVATEMRRDAALENNDNIEIVLDTHRDRRNAYYFSTNPAGALIDGRVTENQPPALEWDGIWTVRARVTEDGWTAEFEIPFKTIGFKPGLAEWGFNISRFLARERETSRWASPSLDAKVFQVVKAGSVTLAAPPSQGVGLDIKPHGILGFTRDIGNRDILTPSGTPGADPLGAAHSGGVDIFYRITPNLVSSTTVNTDFAETETDARQVNLTRFELFFPEKRSFFLEDAGIFEFARIVPSGPPELAQGGDLIPFFSRRIGLAEMLSPETGPMGYEVPIRVGEKLTGKIGRLDIGLMDVQTGSHAEPDRIGRPGFRIPGKNLSVGRVKANFLSQSYVGAMFTNGDPTGETSNQMGGVDAKLATSNFLGKGKNLSLTLFGT